MSNDPYIDFWQKLIDLAEAAVLAENASKMKELAAIEKEIQEMLEDKLATSVVYKKVGNTIYVDGKAPATTKARTQSQLALQVIANKAIDTFELGKQGYTYISKLTPNAYADMATRSINDWNKIVGRLNDPSIYSPEQIKEAKDLLKKTRDIQKKYKGFDNFTKRNVDAAKFGRFSNIYAMNNDTIRLYAEGINANTTGTGSPQKKKVLEFVKTRYFNRNKAFLSFTAHLRSLYCMNLVDFGKETGMKFFMCLVPKQATDNIKGVMAQYVGKIKTVEQWNAVYDIMNKGRKSKQSFPGLGLHHGSSEYYVPIPDYLMEKN